MAVGSTRGKRRLGRFVRAIMERTTKDTGLTQTDLASRADTSRQTLIRLFTGEGLPKWPTVLSVLYELEATRDEVKRAKELHAVADVDTKNIAYAPDLPAEYLRLRMDEEDASDERTLNQTVIPGLLQIPLYAEAMALKSRRRVKAGWSDHAGAERQSRQALLYRDSEPLNLHSLIDEAALTKLVGGRDVMADQLAHLVSAAQHPNITIQVLPDDLGAYGAHSNPLTLLSFPEADEPDCAYVDGLLGVEIVEDSAAVDVLSAVWRDVAADAMSPADSIAFISKLKDRVRRS